MKTFHKIVQFWTRDELTSQAPKYAICDIVRYALKDAIRINNSLIINIYDT